MTKQIHYAYKWVPLFMIPVLILMLSVPLHVHAAEVCPDCDGAGMIVVEHKHDFYCDGYVRIEGGTYTPQLLAKAKEATPVFRFNKAQNGDRLVIEQWYYLTSAKETTSIPMFRSSCDFLMKSGDSYASSNSKSGVIHSAVYWTQSEADVHGNMACYIRSGTMDPNWSKLRTFIETCLDSDLIYEEEPHWCRDTDSLDLINRSDCFSIHAPAGVKGHDEQIYTYATARLTHVENIDGFRNRCFFNTSTGAKTESTNGSITYRAGRWSVWRPAYLCDFEEGENVCMCETCKGTGYDPNQDSDTGCLVEADIPSSFVVIIPKRIVLGPDGSVTYTVSMLGDIKGSECVHIKPKLTDGAILLKESGGKKDVVAAVGQPVTVFSVSGSAEGRIAADLPAGNYRGVLEFELALTRK